MAQKSQMDDNGTLRYDQDNHVSEAIANGLVYPLLVTCFVNYFEIDFLNL